jgi:hypothetical protein
VHPLVAAHQRLCAVLLVKLVRRLLELEPEQLAAQLARRAASTLSHAHVAAASHMSSVLAARERSWSNKQVSELPMQKTTRSLQCICLAACLCRTRLIFTYTISWPMCYRRGWLHRLLQRCSLTEFCLSRQPTKCVPYVRSYEPPAEVIPSGTTQPSEASIEERAAQLSGSRLSAASQGIPDGLTVPVDLTCEADEQVLRTESATNRYNEVMMHCAVLSWTLQMTLFCSGFFVSRQSASA